MTTASVGPNFGESDLGAGTLLQQQLILRVEQEDTESPVQLPLWLLWGEAVYIIFAGMSSDAVLFIH